MNKTAAAIVGLTFFGLLMLSLLWAIFGGFIKAYTPSEFGYSKLGWVHAGYRTFYVITVPKWAGWQGFASALQRPFRHYKVYLRQGERLVADYDVNIERGGMHLSVYRTNLSRILQGVRVDDLKFHRLPRGIHKGTFEYTAPADGIYQFKYDIRWDRETRKQAFSLPDYDLVYDIRWRLQR